MTTWLWPIWLILEAGSGLVVLLLCLLTPLVSLFLRRSSGPGSPILLVHGYGMLQGSMLVVGWRLGRAGYRPAAVGYTPLTAPEHAAERIAARAAALAASSPTGKIDIVAHSVGGLLSRAARALPAGGAIGRIVTLGTPHRGAWWTHLPIGPLRSAMRAGTFGLGDAGDLSITSRADLIIRWNRATLDPPSTTLVLDAAGHAGLLLDGRAHRAAIAHLAQP